MLEIPNPSASAAIAIAPASPTQPAVRRLVDASIIFQKRSALSCVFSSEAKTVSGSNFSPVATTILSNNFRVINEDNTIASVNACLHINEPAVRIPFFISCKI